MDIEHLETIGWKLSTLGYNVVTDEGKLTNPKEIEKKAIDFDIREIGGCALPAELPKGRNEIISGVMVVQIQKVRNISAPKANVESRAAPRMLKLKLCDGTQVCCGIEMAPLPQISLNTPPGTKLRLKGDLVVNGGLLLLYPENTELLGGIVTNLVEKWNVNREFQTLAKQSRRRYGMEGGPPPWIPFGEKFFQLSVAEKNFKSLDDAGKENNKDNDEFEAQRRDAIAEAGKSGYTKKVFGGGTKPIVDKNIQAIMEKGFSLLQADHALRQHRTVDRALKSLLKRNPRGDDKEKGEKEGGGGGGGGRGNRRKGDEEGGHKPSGKVSLYQYLEEKLPVMDKDKEEKKDWESGYNNSKKSNDMNSFYGNNGRSHRGSRGSCRGGIFTNDGPDRRTYREDSYCKETNKAQRWQNTSHNNQKPPRFQNQNRKTVIEQQSTELYDNFVSRTDPCVSSTSNSRTNADSYFTTYNKPNVNSQNINQYNGYRNNFKVDNIGYNNHHYSGGDCRNHNSSFSKPSGMPEIPEFPYKDSSSFGPFMQQNLSTNNIMNNANFSSGHKQESNKYKWKEGDKCMAKYWEDNRYYNAEVTGISKKTCVVRFMGYENFEEVLQDDCIPITDELRSRIKPSDDSTSSFNNGGLEFRKGGVRGNMRLCGKSDGGMGPRRTHQRLSQPVYMPPPGRQNK